MKFFQDISMVMTRRILVVTQRSTDYIEMARVAQRLQQRGHTIVFMHHSGGGADPVVEQLDALRQQGQGEYILIGDVPRKAPTTASDSALPETPTPRRRSLFVRILRRLVYPPRWLAHRIVWLINQGLNRLFCEVPSAFRLFSLEAAALATPDCAAVLRSYRTQASLYESAFQQTLVDVVLLPEDVVGPITPLIIKTAHQHNVPSLIIPYTIANQKEPFFSLADNEPFQANRSLNRFVSKRFPHWLMADEHRSLVRLPGPHVIAHELLGITPPDPWMMNSGFANAIAVENEAMADYYAEAGIPRTKLRVVGAAYDDVLFEYQKNRQACLAEVRKELGIHNDKPLLVVSGAPNQLSFKSTPFCEYPTMEAIADSLGASLQGMSDQYEIIVRPHPGYVGFGEELARSGFRSTLIDTAKLVAVSDLFIAFASATIRWAIACGVPTINWDVFHYCYDDFAGVPGVLNVTKQSEFVAALESMKWGSDSYRQAKSAIELAAPRWGRMDGHSVDRIEDLIHELCSLNPVPRTAA